MTFMAILEQSTVQRETIITFQIKQTFRFRLAKRIGEKDGEIVEKTKFEVQYTVAKQFITSYTAPVLICILNIYEHQKLLYLEKVK